MTFVTENLTLWPWGQVGMLTLSIPTYHMNMVMIWGHWGSQMSISKFDLATSISDLGGKNSKFLRLNLLQGVPRNISVCFYRFSIKTVGENSKSMKELTSLATAPVEVKIGQPWNVCPGITLSKMRLPYPFQDNRTSGMWSKSPNGQTNWPLLPSVGDFRTNSK